MKKKQTPSQTIGPFFAYGLTAAQYGYPFDQLAGADMISDTPAVDGERIRIVGRIFDGSGETIPDAMVEIWQADAQGRYQHPADGRGTNSAFKGFGRMGTGTDAEHRFIFETIKPASVDGHQAPHITVCIFARGLLSHLYTRLYFSDEADANMADPVLANVPPDRRTTLIAERTEQDGSATYQFDIHLQGSSETIFLDL